MNSEGNLIKLHEYKGYTIDFRLKEFRKVDFDKNEIIFIPFSSKKGKRLLEEHYSQLRG